MSNFLVFRNRINKSIPSSWSGSKSTENLIFYLIYFFLKIGPLCIKSDLKRELEVIIYNIWDIKKYHKFY